MGLSLKKEEMTEYLENAKAHGEYFKCMLWGTVIADPSSYQNQRAVTRAMAHSSAPGVAGSKYQRFCYIGLTEKSLYVIAVDTYNTSKIIGTFALDIAKATSLNMRKGFLGASYTVSVRCGGLISLTVKKTSLGTDIRDQKTRVEQFISALEALKGGISG